MNEMYNNGDFLEFVIKCLFRDKQVMQKALDLQVVPEDFGTLDVYRAFVKAAMEIGQAPVEPKLALTMLSKTLKEFGIVVDSNPTIIEFYEYIYRGDLDDPVHSADYVRSNFADFLLARRYQLLQLMNIGNPVELVAEAEKLVGDIALKNSTQEIRSFTPFKDMVLVEKKDSLPTGFSAIDGATQGLNYQEFAIIIGHSGSGKTAMAVYSALQNAKVNKKVLYLSIEEPGENICNRAYSNIFRISYTDLHKGSFFAQEELRTKFNLVDEISKNGLQNNFKIEDMRAAAPVTAQYIQNYLDQMYLETGYHPDLVYIDQLDYLGTNKKYDQEWMKFSHIAFEVDDLSNHLIGGKHPFSVYLLHQASGKLTRRFSNNEIAGFKGIIKPADMVLAIGRDSTQDTTVSIFSLKSRHAKNFHFEYVAELEYMNFEPLDAATADRINIEKKDKSPAKSRGGYRNMPPKPVVEAQEPPKAELLPSPHTGYHSAV
jgi:hypothetical protein